MAEPVPVAASAAGPALSICVLNWNTRGLLRDCLESLFADPDSAGWEIIVVDNASTDGSAAMVSEQFPVARLIANERNLGFAGGNNVGLAGARGRHLLILNSDTRVESGTLGQLVDHLDRNPRDGAVGPRLVNADGSLQLSCGRPPGLGAEIVHKLLLHRAFPFFRFGRWDHKSARSVGWVTGACLMVRRAAVDQVGFLDDSIYMCFEDLEWCMRLRQAGWGVVYLPVGRVVHLEGQSIAQNLEEMLVVSQQSLYYLFQKHFGPVRVAALRALTAVEMLLRSIIWTGGAWLAAPRRRGEARQRLAAYRRILHRTLLDRSYWDPGRAAVSRDES